MKGIILAAGLGTRLHPLTVTSSKQLLPVFDKPMIYYPISTLMLAGIREILIISNPLDQSSFQKLLGGGNSFGVEFSYLTQPRPNGLAEALVIAKDFLDGGNSALILGDNLFYGPGLGRRLFDFQDVKGAQAFGYEVANPSDYGVAILDDSEKVVAIEEKPSVPKSKVAITGLYFFDNYAPDLAATLIPSPRGEIEIVDLLKLYLDKGLLNLSLLPRGTTWLDMGTFDKLQDAATYVRIVQERTGTKVGDPLEISQVQGWV